MTPTARPSLPSPTVALFDLDGTLTWRDTLFPFLIGFLRRRPSRLLSLWRLPGALIRYGLVDRDRGALKSRVIRMVMRGESRSVVEAWADSYVRNLKPRGRFRPAALAALETHLAAGDRAVLLSASPDLYVPKIGALLGFERTLCTEVRWSGDRLDGSLVTANRRGEEKSHCLSALRARYPGLRIIAYGNSASDLDHMRQADQALLVNADAKARRLAADLGISVADWT